MKERSRTDNFTLIGGLIIVTATFTGRGNPYEWVVLFPVYLIGVWLVLYGFHLVEYIGDLIYNSLLLLRIAYIRVELNSVIDRHLERLIIIVDIILAVLIITTFRAAVQFVQKRIGESKDAK